MQDMRGANQQDRAGQSGAAARSSEEVRAGKHKKLRKARGKIFGMVAVLVLVVMAGVIVFQQLKINGTLSEEEAARGVQDKLAKIMILPEEDALVSNIEDIDKIEEQPFFTRAENGDKVLIFVQAAKIVIYREGTNQVVNAGPLIDDRAATDEDSADK